ncbi:LysR family transcriptional regulator [Devosia sp. 63-57]|uniref:LysR family transcriptional regulator n=1 Tax=Devosia sp. 63-57 TaxID=1895751 RepID=UPI00086D8494|nr:LysR family transcriptional regulator [Devosia sp. 63-57]ODT48979.1 MAG: LysR family transcriptional regulator [Pelagibacterium sp. SCN 63-126]ODU89372.1 MAG: LysR family transcriptional regulator [Pelagibacterium sp. SCN 63-17]OJX44090.1 MAG: LysR family transcriptional regulator [Devosia sp. 63-57]
MKMRGMDFDWNLVRAFMATVEAGSLSAAARQLGLAQPTLGRQVAALEVALGVTLFERPGRALVLTEAGRLLVEHARSMGEAADGLTLAAAGQSQAMDGVVRVTAIELYAAHVLPPFLALMEERAPKLRVELIAADAVQDLVRREADIAIRHGRPDQDGLVARRCADTRARLYAAPSYFEHFGRPRNGEELAWGRLIGFIGDDGEMLAELNRRGAKMGPENCRPFTNSGSVGWEWVRRGMGMALMLEKVAEATPGVELVWPEMEPVPIPVWLVTHREIHTSARIRLVFDLLAEHLGA